MRLNNNLIGSNPGNVSIPEGIALFCASGLASVESGRLALAAGCSPFRADSNLCAPVSRTSSLKCLKAALKIKVN
jgi:hypothetical protein